MSRIVGRTEQSFLFAGKVNEENRSTWSGAVALCLHELLRKFKRRDNAGAIISRTIKDLIAFESGVYSKVIEV